MLEVTKVAQEDEGRQERKEVDQSTYIEDEIRRGRERG